MSVIGVAFLTAITREQILMTFFPCILCNAPKYINPGHDLLVTEMQIL
jgi:hypothetical protein